MDKGLNFISNYVASLSYSDLPATTIREAKFRLVDSIGCAMNAYNYEPCPAVRRLCVPVESPFSARVFGSLLRTTPEMAAFANSTMVRSMDLNDVYFIKSPTHPSDGIPAVLAMAEALHADGKSLLLGIVLNHEMHVPFVEWTPVREGWDSSAITATLGSAMGAGRILGLNREQLANTAAMAIMPNVTLFMRNKGELSTYKEVYAGMAARQGIFAALMAREGLTGPGDTIEGLAGLEKMVTGPIEWKQLGGKGIQFGIERSNLKRFPVAGRIQIFVKTALKLRKKVAAKDVEKLTIKTHKFGATFARSPESKSPKTRQTADHSVQAAVAIALIEGNLTPQSWIRNRFLDQDVSSLMSRIEVIEEPAFTTEFPAKNNCLMTVNTFSGETRSVHGIVTGTTDEDTWTDEDVQDKYITMASEVLTPKQAAASLNCLWHVEEMDDVSKILDNLQV